MKYLKGKEEKKAIEFLEQAGKIAKAATCEQAKCGSLIIKDDEIIGVGFNSPPMDLESQKRCSIKSTSYSDKVTDKTCCIHAEQRAIMDALHTNPNKLAGSRLYFSRLKEDETVAFSGKPYCTICSKMSLDVGISEFVLWHEDGVCVYSTEEYNDLSFNVK